MSQFAPLVSVSEALRNLLWDRAVVGDPAIQAILTNNSQVTLAPPYAILAGSGSNQSYLSVYLFRVQPNTTVRTGIGPRIQSQAVPAAVDLFYLITPITTSVENDQRLLGKVIKVLHEAPVLESVAGGQPQPIRISEVTQTLEEISALWTAFGQPLRLAACYSAGTVFVS